MSSRTIHQFAVTFLVLGIYLQHGACQVYSWINQSGDMYNQPCINQLNFTWTYTPESPVPASIDWSKQNAGGTFDLVANFFGGVFTPAASYTGRVIRIGNTAELGLKNPTSADDGTYRVSVTDNNGLPISSDNVVVSAVTTATLDTAGIRATCGNEGKEVTCAGVTSLGIPGIILTLSYGSYSVDNGGTQTTVSQELTSRETVKCSISGPATECLASDVVKSFSVECGLPGDTDCLIILIIIIIIIVILVLALIIFHIVIFYVKVSFKVMGILFFVNVILAVAAIIIGIVGIVAFALCEVIAAIIAIVIGVLTHLYKFFLSKHVLKKADVPHRHLCVCFYAYPWKTDDGDAPNGDATNTEMKNQNDHKKDDKKDDKKHDKKDDKEKKDEKNVESEDPTGRPLPPRTTQKTSDFASPKPKMKPKEGNGEELKPLRDAPRGGLPSPRVNHNDNDSASSASNVTPHVA